MTSTTDSQTPAAGASGSEPARESALRDYRIAYRSRQASLLGRTEVLTGKAKFGIFGGGKEVPQLAMARAFRKGDFRAGYYRDQTFMMAIGELSLRSFFSQLYADPDPKREPASAGRQMNAHFATHLIDESGQPLRLVDRYNSAADLSPTGSQMPKLVGLAYASRIYREVDELSHLDDFSDHGNEIAFGTIGNASCAEGMVWETINAVGVLRAPLLLSVWDDDYGISVPNAFQITKGNLTEILHGFQRRRGGREGYEIYTVEGWNYPALLETYLMAAEIVRRDHIPAIVHVTDLTQPQGHSTSGSHERYKTAERLAWEAEHDCVTRMRSWIVEQSLASEAELEEMEREDTALVREEQRAAWKEFREPLEEELEVLVGILQQVAAGSESRERVETVTAGLLRKQNPLRRDLLAAAKEGEVAAAGDPPEVRQPLVDWQQQAREVNRERYASHLYSGRALEIPEVPPEYDDDSPELNGFEVVNACFDAAFARLPELFAFGEDVGQLGDVNQGFLGLQEKYGPRRISDTGIRECTIVGQAVGMALRGLRPIAEIQYLDYLLYALQIISDDLATLHWRSAGRQRAPVILRTRGHRLEGIWHSGSPMGGILHLARGLYVCVPRDMTRAAGMYNTLLQADEPALVVEVLNGYRIKERLPRNIGEMTVPLGVPEVLRPGRDATVVTYGACCRVVLAAAELLAEVGVEAEVVDLQTLLPFDRTGVVTASLARTNRLVVVDEDVPGGASAFIVQQVMEGERGFWQLDAEPVTVTGTAHRPAYGSDGDYFSKPSRETVFDAVYRVVHEAAPARYPSPG